MSDPNLPTNSSYVDHYQPPVSGGVTSTPAQPAAVSSKPVASSAENPESLALQNIFALLGIVDGTEEQKETFLDELQQVIWEDFLENDVELLITQSESVELKKMLNGSERNDLQKQDEVLAYLQGLIPDLEEIMLEKALELKEDMVRERLAGMREYFSGKDESLAQIDKAEQLINQNHWKSATQVLNQLK
jgi:hypothetical protein